MVVSIVAMVLAAPVLWVDDSRAPELAQVLVPELVLRLPELRPTRLAGEPRAPEDPLLELIESPHRPESLGRLEVQLRLFVREDELLLAETLSVPLPSAMSARYVAVRVETALRLAPRRARSGDEASSEGEAAGTVVETPPQNAPVIDVGAGDAETRASWAWAGLVEAQAHAAAGESTAGALMGLEHRRGLLLVRAELDGRWPMVVRAAAPTIRLTEGAVALVAGATHALGAWSAGLSAGPGVELVHAVVRPGTDRASASSVWRGLVRGALWFAHGAEQGVAPIAMLSCDWTPTSVRHRWQGEAIFDSGAFELRVAVGVTGDLGAR